MKPRNWMLLIFITALALALTAAMGWATGQGKSKETDTKVKLPAAVAKAVKDNRPDAEIDKMEVEKEAGIVLCDIEFKAGKGEIEIAEDGTVMDIATIIEMKDVPKAAADAVQKATQGAEIKQLEKSEVRAEIQKDGQAVCLSYAPIYFYPTVEDKPNALIEQIQNPSIRESIEEYHISG